MTIPLQTLERQSVQEFEPKESQGAPFWYVLPANNPNDDTLLPEWGLHQRDRTLRDLYRNQFNWIAQSAVAALIRKYTQTPHEVKGGRNLVSYFQNMLQDAEFGSGWSDFSAKWLLDYLTCDYGAYWEVIGGGKPDRELKGRVTGIAHLDSLRCIPTGNLEFPVVYWSRRSGKLHRLHHTRIVRLVDMPDGDEMRMGAGLCSLSRAVAMIQQQIPMMQYVAGMMSDVPANGVMFLEGLTATQYTTAMNDYKLQRETRKFKGPVAISGNSSQKASGQYIPFAVAPEGFDYSTYIDIAVNAFAAAFGIDRQDIWPLQGKMAGTATQSEVMAAKAMGMAYGDLLSKVKRAINTRVLPASMEFDFEYRDEEKDKQVAERTTILLNNANTLKSLGVTDEVIVRYLAAQDETLRDVLLDENGEIIALPDDDEVEIQDKPQTTDDVLADDTTATDSEGEAPTAPDAQTATDGTKEKTLSAYAYIPLGNNIDVLRIQRLLKERLTDERIEWQIPATFHVTLVYADTITDTGIANLAQLIHVEQMVLFAEYLDVFETPDGKALHIRLEHKTVLDDMQRRVYEGFAVSADGISLFSIPEAFKPHITLAYMPNDISFEVEAVSLSILADTIEVSRNDYDPVLSLYAPTHIKAQKDISDTQTDFMRRFNSIQDSARNKEITRARAGILFRGLLSRFGPRAFGDGMEEAGVPRNRMDAQDNIAIQSLLAQQSVYVSNFLDVLFSETGITDGLADGKAVMWFNKSVYPFYDAGRMSAGANGMREFVLGITEHCDDCKRLAGQIHRLREFITSGWYPKSGRLKCRGFRCECELVRRPGAQVRGVLPI